LTPRPWTRLTLRELVERYRDAVVPKKRGAEIEACILNAFLRDYPKLCGKALSALTPRDFAAYRDDRLQTIQPSTLSRELSPLRHMFKVASTEWGLPVRNPLQGLALLETRKAGAAAEAGRTLPAPAGC
jgi:hypothetical protein